MKKSATERCSKPTVECTLEELDGEQWGEPPLDSYVVRASHALRRKPLQTLSDEDLRLAVGQGIGLEWLVPLMLQRLSEDPFRAGDFYEGDLLESLARIPPSYWTEHPVQKAFLATEVIAPALLSGRLPEMIETTRQAVADLHVASQ